MSSLQKTNISGIYYQELKSGKITYYARFRDTTQNGKVVKVKLMTKDKHKQSYLKEAVLILEEIKQERESVNDSNIQTEEEQFYNYANLNTLADFYFYNRFRDKKSNLIAQYGIKTEEEFLNNANCKAKMQNVKSDYNRYNSNLRLLKWGYENKLNYNAPYFDWQRELGFKKRYVNSFITPLGEYPINKLSKTVIKDYIDTHIRSKGLSEKSIFNIVSLLKTIMNYAIKSKKINVENHFEDLGYYKIKNPKRVRRRTLTAIEINNLLNECKKHKNKNVYNSVYLAILTGGRVNTILNIKKQDIDIVNNKIYLYNFKADRQYSLPLNDKAIKYFKEKIFPNYDYNEYIIRPSRKRDQKGQKMKTAPSAIYKIMDQLFNKGLNKQDNMQRDNIVNFHTLRRSIATNLAKSGLSLYDVMVFLNHSNIEQTMKYLNLEENNIGEGINAVMDNIFK